MIDALDAKIIVMLQADARTPEHGHRGRFRVTEATVRKRIVRLRRGGVLQFDARPMRHDGNGASRRNGGPRRRPAGPLTDSTREEI